MLQKEAISNRPLAWVTEVGCLPSVGASKEAVDGAWPYQGGDGLIHAGSDHGSFATGLVADLEVMGSVLVVYCSFSSSSYATCSSTPRVH